MTPLDVINTLRGKEVIVQLKSGKEIKGKLLSFDLNTNIGIETAKGVEFIQGETVTAILKSSEKGVE